MILSHQTVSKKLIFDFFFLHLEITNCALFFSHEIEIIKFLQEKQIPSFSREKKEKIPITFKHRFVVCEATDQRLKM